jgi:hypothetical protein
MTGGDPIMSFNSTDKMSEGEKNILACVGQALGNWSAIELQLSIVFGNASQMPREKARAMFDSIISFDVRMTILDAIMALEQVDEIEAEMWCRMSARLSRLYKKRHEVAHFILINDADAMKIGPFITYEKIHRGNVKRLTAEEIAARSKKFAQQVHLVSWFALRALERHTPGGIGLQLDHATHPNAAPLRALAVQTLEARQSRPPQPPPPDTEDLA